MKAGDILFCGHTHRKFLEELPGGFLFVGPGSVSSPRDGTEGSYAVYEPGRVTVKYLDGRTALERFL